VPHWHRKPIAEWKATTFNAKLETARGLPSFRDAWSQGRCVVPVLGYYEWSGPKTNRQPNYIRLEQNQPYMLLAGLQTRLANGLRTCTILTRAALPEIKEIHARMPVALTSDEAEHWLDHDVGDEEIIARYGLGIQGRLQHHRVAKFGGRDDDVSVIDSIDGFL
jgi:putative SOS response-associated peptidase YedK